MEIKVQIGYEALKRVCLYSNGGITNSLNEGLDGPSG